MAAAGGVGRNPEAGWSLVPFVQSKEEQALRRLGLRAGASEEEIEARFRELAKADHPDTGGSDSAMAELNEAREIALRAARRALVPVALVKDLIGASTQIVLAREERKQATQATIASIIRHNAGRFKRYRRTAGMFAFLSGVGAAFSGGLIETPVISLFRPLSDLLFAILGFAAAYLGMLAWLYWSAAEHIEEAIADAAESLDDKTTFVGVVKEIETASISRMPWSRKDLDRLITEWAQPRRMSPLILPIWRLRSIRGTVPLRRLAAHIGSADFSRLLIARGLEKGLFSEQETVIGGQFQVRY